MASHCDHSRTAISIFCSDGVSRSTAFSCLAFIRSDICSLDSFAKYNGRESKHFVVDGPTEGNKNQAFFREMGEVGDILSVCFIISFFFPSSFLFFLLLFLMSREGVEEERVASRDSFCILDRVPSTLLPQMMRKCTRRFRIAKRALFVQEMGKMKSLLCTFCHSCFLLLSREAHKRTRDVRLFPQAGSSQPASAYLARRTTITTTTTTTTTTSITPSSQMGNM